MTNLNAKNTLAISNLAADKPILFFDAGTTDDALRGEQCKKNILHLLPSRAMKADALAQYLLKKRWTKWFLVSGSEPEDVLFVNALKRAAKRFGTKIVFCLLCCDLFKDLILNVILSALHVSFTPVFVLKISFAKWRD